MKPLRLLLLPLLMAGSAAASSWVVAPTGNDRAIGNAAAPLATLAEALRRAARRTDGDSDILLKAGTYPMLATAEINATHASASMGVLTVHGEDGAVLSGFRSVPASAWKKLDTATNNLLRPEVKGQVIQAALSAVGPGDAGHLSRRGFNVAEVRQTPPALLFVNGAPLPLASWPDVGAAPPGMILATGPTRDGADSKNFYKKGGSFIFNNARMTNWAKEKNLWVDGTFGYDWEWSFNGIKTINRFLQSITLTDGEVSGLLNLSYLHPGFRVVNAVSEISLPGEYCLDSTKKRIVILPPAAGDGWKNTATMTWSAVPLLTVNGAQGVNLTNLTLEGARDGLMVIKGSAHDVALQSVNLRRNGGDGLVADGAHITLTDCTIEDCGGYGVKLTGGTPATLAPSNHSVTRCVFQRNAWWSHVFDASLELDGVGHQVTDCQFLDLPHMAIEVKGNDFLIENNLFRRTCRDFRDMGAIYFNLGEDPLERGTVVTGNFFDDIGGAGGNRSAVYLDNATMGVTVQGNLFRHIGATADDWTVMVHGGGHNKVANNVYLDCPLPNEVAFMFATWAVDQLPAYEQEWTAALTASDAAFRINTYPDLATFSTEDHVHPPGISVADNLVFYSGIAPTYGALRVEGGTAVNAGDSGNLAQPTLLDNITGLIAPDGIPDNAKALIDAWQVDAGN